MGKVFRELLYRMHHPETCVVPREIHIHNPRLTDVVMIVWKEARADEVGRQSMSVCKFIDETRDTLHEHGFHDLHPKNVGRFDGEWKWFDL